MVLQKKWSEMSPAVRERARMMVHNFEKSVCSNTVGRAGIIKFNKRRVYAHQAVAVHRLVLKNHEVQLLFTYFSMCTLQYVHTSVCAHAQVPWSKRKSALLAIHDLGLGKTLTAILAIATVRNGCPTPFRALVLCPKAVLTAWADALESWTTLGPLVLVGHKQTELTSTSIDAAQVILTTPDVLVAAFKTFVVSGSTEEDKKKPKMQRFHHAPALPPVHPIFALLTREAPVFALTVVDELHLFSNPTSLTGHVLSMFCADSVYTLGLTGTPVTNSPKQLANLAKVLNAQPVWLQQPRHFADRKDPKRINRNAVQAYHKLLVDRVDGTFVTLPSKTYRVLEYDPWIGLHHDGQKSIVDAHNRMLASAQKLVASNDTEALELAQGKWGERERKLFTATVALGHYEFCADLGAHGAANFSSVAPPSQTVKIIQLMLNSRQAAGHVRIVVFSESVTELKILQRHLVDVGEVMLYDGTLSGHARGNMLRKFLSCDKGVLLLSSAGAIGVSICPGVQVLFSVGTLSWNASTVDQAFGRVHRLGQTRPVEVVQFVARNGITAAKLLYHDDKRERLQAAARDENFSEFVVDNSLWRLQCQLLSKCSLLDENGNYLNTPQQQHDARRYYHQLEAADAKGLPRPTPPLNLPKKPLLAHEIVLPPPLALVP